MEKTALHHLADFCERFAAPGAHFGTWVDITKDDADVLHMPFLEHSALARDFVTAAYDNDWVNPAFDWIGWSATAQAQSLMLDADALAVASEEDLIRLLTTCIRRDRFVEGGLRADFERGLILRVAQRACAIIDKDQR